MKYFMKFHETQVDEIWWNLMKFHDISWKIFSVSWNFMNIWQKCFYEKNFIKFHETFHEFFSWHFSWNHEISWTISSLHGMIFTRVVARACGTSGCISNCRSEGIGIDPHIRAKAKWGYFLCQEKIVLVVQSCLIHNTQLPGMVIPVCRMAGRDGKPLLSLSLSCWFWSLVSHPPTNTFLDVPF
jgi:hypothetical protein